MLTRITRRKSGLFPAGSVWTVLMLLAAALTWTGFASAASPPEPPPPVSTQFDVTGFLQEATTISTAQSSGGSLKVNGQVITVPTQTIVILPANALTWSELFAQAPAPYGPTQTGLALTDIPAPLTTYEIRVVGNRVTSATGGDQYIAGLIYISQQGLNSGQGYINFIDYTKGEMRVGGLPDVPTSGTRVRINDPGGRYGRVMSPDMRFTVHPQNLWVPFGSGRSPSV